MEQRSAAVCSFFAFSVCSGFCFDFCKTVLASQIKGNMVFVAVRWRNVCVCVCVSLLRPSGGCVHTDVSNPRPTKVCNKYDRQSRKHHTHTHTLTETKWCIHT